MNKPVFVAPSIFAADFAMLGEGIRLCEKSGVDAVHYDVMDNHFVPNISFGNKMIQDLSSRTGLKSDVHLMIDLDSSRELDQFISLPVDHLTVHLEATSYYISDYLDLIKKSGKTAGISIRPGTPVETVFPYISQIDLLLLMSVEPGFSGQSFKDSSIDRIRQASEMIGDRPVRLQVDGGVNRANWQSIAEAGADYLVIGSAFFKDQNPGEWCDDIHSIQ